LRRYKIWRGILGKLVDKGWRDDAAAEINEMSITTIIEAYNFFKFVARTLLQSLIKTKVLFRNRTTTRILISYWLFRIKIENAKGKKHP